MGDGGRAGAPQRGRRWQATQPLLSLILMTRLRGRPRRHRAASEARYAEDSSWHTELGPMGGEGVESVVGDRSQRKAVQKRKEWPGTGHRGTA